MSWMYLSLAIFFEVGWVLTLPLTRGYSELGPSVLNVVLAIGGMVALSYALKVIPAYVGYPVWVGVSIVLVTGISATFLSESICFSHYVFLFMIVIGVVGLKAIH